MTIEEANLAWHFYLQEERQRVEAERRTLEEEEDPVEAAYWRHYNEDEIPAPSSVRIPASVLRLLPRPSLDKHLWRVSVRNGREEALAFTLFRKAMSGTYRVSSVVGRVTCPGWIYIEAKDFADVQNICLDVPDIHVRQIFSIAPDDAPLVLRETPFTYPVEGSWVRLNDPKLKPYKHDLAWISEQR
ncbi:hypothetical protein H0H92_000412, partial [Tricholoma furcatifolium]